MRIVAAGAVLMSALAMAGCSSTTTSSGAVEASAAAATPAATGSLPPLVGKAWALPSPSSSAEQDAVWCSSLEQVVNSASSATTTRTGAQKQLNALATYEQLWTIAAERQYVTEPEAKVNAEFLQGYAKLVTLEGDGQTAESPEVTAITNELNALTNANQALFDSSASKITSLCGLDSSTGPSTAPSAN